MQANKLLENNFDKMVETLQKVIAIDTTLTEPADNAPFGLGNKQCLEYVLELGAQMGFDTYNCDNYAGHIELKGTGSEVLGVLGHLDVVPASQNDGWIHPPFSGAIDNNKMYGRGTMDDKGPMISCLYALKALKDSGYTPNKTIRLIFGCDEETSMRCVKHYFKKVAKPDIAFSPDGDFPVIDREKGIYHLTLNLGALNGDILSIKAGTRANVVPNKATAVVKGNVAVSSEGAEVTFDGTNTTITTFGKNAHGSTPSEGKNASWQLFNILANLYGDSQLQFIVNKMCDYTGANWGINLHDDVSGDLTCNIGVVNYSTNLELTVDIRFPVTFTCADIDKLIADTTPFAVTDCEAKEPLYVPSDSHLVTTLLSVYDSVTGEKGESMAIGGGTYSRALSNCVAFGPLFIGKEQTIHMPNEYIELDDLKMMSDIYLGALQELSK